ncbi:MAG: helix-turn-helix domain-containing protein [Labilithrix sp.]|nr:helix-turn-helix domain-containing protein [Labilithrix sp.]
MRRPRASDYRAELERVELASARVVRCVCDPLEGERAGAEIARTDGAFYGVVLVVRGMETVSSNGKSVRLGPGDAALWDSERACSFVVHEPLEKVSMLLPKRRFERVVPEAARFVGAVTGAGTGAGALAVQQLLGLSQHAASLGVSAAERVLDASLELLGAAFGASAHAPSRTSSVRRWIEARLHDPELSPTRIADAHDVSVRTLHAWFQAEGLSLSRWILQARLDRCKRDLLRRDGAHVTEIAFRWGFNDVAHFSRAFKRAYGRGPRAFRDEP